MKLDSPLLRRVLDSNGVIESGQIADMKRYRIRSDTVHVRLLHESRTLCGVSLRNNDQWAWQFYHRGRVLESLPSGIEGRDGCKRCQSNPVVAATRRVVNEKRVSLTRLSRSRKREKARE